MEASAKGIFLLGFFFASGCLTAYTGYRITVEFVRAVAKKLLDGRMNG